ncbi:hypothetical protein VP01_887g3 [Puccinia sorghi]|uniref:Uncharacterized protein n=1 Tax=Puccinia sorghi TaxID=27349 RepID=A0A0L6U863_9BASI|nr:hypothetical protein VP01_887g3 [Puccinia sorghi]
MAESLSHTALFIHIKILWGLVKQDSKIKEAVKGTNRTSHLNQHDIHYPDFDLSHLSDPLAKASCRRVRILPKKTPIISTFTTPPKGLPIDFYCPKWYHMLLPTQQ